MCDLYGVTRAGFYAWRKRQPSSRSQEDARLLEHVRAAHARSRGFYGSPRVRGQLHLEGVSVGRRRVARLMREAGLQGRSARLYRQPKVARRAFYAAIPYRQESATTQAPDQVWVSDVTYLKVAEQWRYMAVVMDRHSRRIVGWSLSDRRDAALTIQALRQSTRNPGRPRCGVSQRPRHRVRSDGVPTAAHPSGHVAEHEPCWQDERQRAHGVVLPLHEVRGVVRQDLRQ